MAADAAGVWGRRLRAGRGVLRRCAATPHPPPAGAPVSLRVGRFAGLTRHRRVIQYREPLKGKANAAGRRGRRPLQGEGCFSPAGGTKDEGPLIRHGFAVPPSPQGEGLRGAPSTPRTPQGEGLRGYGASGTPPPTGGRLFSPAGGTKDGGPLIRRCAPPSPQGEGFGRVIQYRGPLKGKALGGALGGRVDAAGRRGRRPLQRGPFPQGEGWRGAAVERKIPTVAGASGRGSLRAGERRHSPFDRQR